MTSCLGHLLESPISVSFINIYCFNRIGDHVHFKSVLFGIQGGSLDAIIGCQSCDEQGGYIVVSKIKREVTAGGFKSGIPIIMVFRAFQEYLVNFIRTKRWMKLRALGVANTVLRPFIKVNGFLWMPIFRGNNQGELIHQLIDDRNDFVTVRNSQGSSRAKIVLYIYNR